jgi:hypothetical protein
MNERIKLLTEQATKHYPATESSGEFSTFDKEKFAELIVQECVNVLHDNELWNRHISHALKEHFGVEE